MWKEAMQWLVRSSRLLSDIISHTPKQFFHKRVGRKAGVCGCAMYVLLCKLQFVRRMEWAFSRAHCTFYDMHRCETMLWGKKGEGEAIKYMRKKRNVNLKEQEAELCRFNLPYFSFHRVAMNWPIKVNCFSLLWGQEMKASLLFLLRAHVATSNINSF